MTAVISSHVSIPGTGIGLRPMKHAGGPVQLGEGRAEQGRTDSLDPRPDRRSIGGMVGGVEWCPSVVVLPRLGEPPETCPTL